MNRIMGCDIHLYLEGKVGKYYFEKAWIKVERNHDLFAYMAGVRDSFNHPLKMFDPRGLPEDMSFGVKDSYQEWVGDAHHESWLTLEELKSIYKICKDYDLEVIIKMMDIYANNQIVTRAVFWFDN